MGIIHGLLFLLWLISDSSPLDLQAEATAMFKSIAYRTSKSGSEKAGCLCRGVGREKLHSPYSMCEQILRLKETPPG